MPGTVDILRTALRNPLEIWGEPSYEEPWIHTRFINERSLIANDPGLIRHVLVAHAYHAVNDKSLFDWELPGVRTH